MLKKTITFVDYDGTERTEDHYFNLNESEVIRLEASVNGGISKWMEKIVAAQDYKEIMEMVEKFILTAYGEKSNDGRRFEKRNGALAEAFKETEAYNQLFMDLLSGGEAAIAAFVNGVVPKPKQTAPTAAEG